MLIHQALISRPFIDDSYIFYRYAANWAHGLGPVFNRGEYVEGFSSFLWTLILAASAALGLSAQSAAEGLGIVLALGCVLLLARLTLAFVPSRPWLAVLLPLGLAGSPAFVTYASSGMDTVLFAFVLLGAVGGIARHVERLRDGSASRASTSVVVALIVVLVLARAEGPIYALALAAATFLLSGGPGLRSASRARLVLPAAAVVATGLVLAVRELLYGALTPATVMAKGYVSHLAAHALSSHAELAPLWQALRGGIDYAGWPVLVALGLIVVAVVLDRRRQRRLSALATLGTLACLIGLLTAISNSGDWMPYRRLLIPILPLLILLSAWAAVTLAREATGLRARLRLAPAAAAIAAVAGCVLAVAAGGLTSGPSPSTYAAGQLRRLGGLLAASRQPVPLLTNLAGVLPYYAGPRTHVWDMLGLTDIHNARDGYIFSPEFGRTDPSYDFSRHFGLFVSNSSWDFALLLASAEPPSPSAPGGYQLFWSPRWARIPLYVVAPANAAIDPRLQSLCHCAPVALTVAARQRLLARLLAQHAVSPSLLDAARSHAFFPS